MSFRRTGAVALAIVLTAGRLAAQGDGLTIVQRVTTTSSGPVPAAPGFTRIFSQSGRMRMESDDSVAHAPFPARPIVLVAVGAMRQTVLDTARHEYFVLDIAETMRRSKEMQRSAGMEMKIVDPVVAAERVGAGDTILDQATDHWRTVSRFTMSMGIGGTDVRMQSEVTNDYWFGTEDDPATVAATSPAAQGTSSASAAFLDSTFSARMREANERLPKRMPLRTTMTMRISKDGVDVMKSTTTNEVVSMMRAPVWPGLFEVPAGYREVQAPGMPR